MFIVALHNQFIFLIIYSLFLLLLHVYVLEALSYSSYFPLLYSHHIFSLPSCNMGNSLSVDLMDYIPGHLALLYHVDRLPELTSSPEVLASAIKRYAFPSFSAFPLLLFHYLILIQYRYKNFMFLRSYDLAQHTSVEVEWIWHVVCTLLYLFFSF